jgi:site-specific DNA-methyltransferase (cytosine-N4-specific)
MEDMVLIGDALTVLKTLPNESVQCCVTSPPYWGLRDYGVAGQLGREKTPAEYVANLVTIFREVRRVMDATGTLWINLGDSYSNIGKWGGRTSGKHAKHLHGGHQTSSGAHGGKIPGLKPKDLIGIPWMVAFALRADGWYLRSDIIWHKPNVMPESVQDRPTKAHEYVFLLSKSEDYFYDAAAISEPRADGAGKRNKRTVWAINTKAFKGAHFATFPTELPQVCIAAGSAARDLILDPFAGSGATCAVAKAMGRRFLGIELNADYAPLFDKRIAEAV